MEKIYLGAQQLLEDSWALAARVYESGYRPNFIVGVWRGGTPVAIAVHELLHVLGVESDHYAIRTASYTGIAQREQQVRVDGLDYICERAGTGDRVLLVDDVHDTGLSLQQVVADLEAACGTNMPEVRIACPWYKPGNNQAGRAPDYYLHSTDEWLVFPHELDGLDEREMRSSKPGLATILDRLD